MKGKNNKTGSKRLSVKRHFKQYKQENFKKKANLPVTVLYQVLTFVVIAVLVHQAITGKYENCFTCALTLILFLVPNFIEARLKVTLPQTLEVIIILFIFSAEILGEINSFYIRFPWWDNMLHTMNGFLMAAIGFSMVDILNKNERFKFQLSPLFVAVVSFCFSMTIGVLWEFFEFFADTLVGTDMQKGTVLNALASVTLNSNGLNSPVVVKGIEGMKLMGENMTVGGVGMSEYTLNVGGYLDNGLVDTMTDLFVNFIGAVVFSVLGYFYVKSRGKSNFLKRFILKSNTSVSDDEEKQTN